MLETTLQKATAKFLDVIQMDFKYKDKFIWFHVPNESGIRAGAGYYAKRKAQGVKAGVPDIVILLEGGVTLFIELKVDRSSPKTPVNTGLSVLSLSQRTFKKGVERLGFNYYVVCSRNVCDCIDSVKSVLDIHILNKTKR